MKRNSFMSSVLLVVVAGTAWGGQQQSRQQAPRVSGNGELYSVAGEKSKLEVHVYKEGFFKAFGHDHIIAAREISGQVQFDTEKIEASSVRFRVAAKSLTVKDPGESEKDRQEVQATMTSERVLDTKKFPEIDFISRGISSVRKAAAGWEMTLSGLLKVHGVERPVSLPIHVSAEGDHLEAQGEVSLLQTEYGITPIKAGGGVVKVKDRIKIIFSIVATRSTP